MPVFTAWRDATKFDKVAKTVTAVVLDTQWGTTVGINNQARWLTFEEETTGGIAAFFIIHAADRTKIPRKVKYIDDDAVFVGKIVRDGTIVGSRQPL